MNRKLRVGILIDNHTQPAWAYAMLERIIGSSYAEIVLVVTKGSMRPTTKSSIKDTLSQKRRKLDHALYLGYTKLDNKLFRLGHEAFEPKSTRELLRDIPTIEVTPKQTKLSDRFALDDIARIKTYDLDVIVRLGFRILRGDILRVPRYGVWSYHHGDNSVNRGGPAGFWEVFEQHPVTGCILQVINEDLDNGQVLCSSFSATDYASVKRNKNRYYWRAVSFVPRKLEELFHKGPERFFAESKETDHPPMFYDRRLYREPTNLEFAPLLTKHVARYAQMKFERKLYRDQWQLRFDLRDGLSTSFWRFQSIVPPNDRFWADPHLLYRDGKYYIFLEEYLYQTQRGHISVIVMDEKGNYTPPVKVLECPYHLSYPFVFTWNDEIYMLPETANNFTIELWRAVEFPLRWERHAVLMNNVKAVDGTLHFHRGRWWLFCAIEENPGSAGLATELFIFSSDRPDSTEWKPHPKNPVISDVRSARPAGALWTTNGELYRPSQDCSVRYGHATKINKVTRFDETHYSEEVTTVIEPRWEPGIQAVHTLSHVHRLTVIDVVFKRPIWHLR